MSKFIKCATCLDYHFDNDKCKPKWEVYHESYLDDGPREVRAASFIEAADKYANWYNLDSDYDLMNDHQTINIKSPDGEIKKMKISAEPSIHYNSEEAETVLNSVTFFPNAGICVFDRLNAQVRELQAYTQEELPNRNAFNKKAKELGYDITRIKYTGL